MSVGNTAHWVKPEVLRALREAMGLSYDEVEQQARKLVKAHYAPLTRQDLESWEQGLDSPDLEHLETLSEIYCCPVGYFFLPEPPSLALPLSYRGLALDKESRLSPLTRQALRRFLDLSEWIAALMDEHRIAWEVTVRPTEAPPLEVLVAREQERLGFSEGVSRQWETAEDALAWWRRQIERQGIFVFEMEWEPDEVRGASRWVASRLPFLLINRRDAEAAIGRLFTLLHEYAHLLTDREGVVCDFRGRGESFAHRFAAHMLLPWERFGQSLPVRRGGAAIAAPAGFERGERREPWGGAKARRPLTEKERKAREIGMSAIRVLLALEGQGALPLMDAAYVLGMRVEGVLEFLEWARSELMPGG